MSLPAQGFRHAAMLLIANRVKSLGQGVSPEATGRALAALARELLALSVDMKMTPDAAGWVIEEYERTLERLIQAGVPVDAAAANARARRVLASIGQHPGPADRRDVFIVYVPEDRLPVAAPLAVELTKRRISVAISEYEVGGADEFAAAIERGLHEHGAGVVLATPRLARQPWAEIAMTTMERLIAQAGGRLRSLDDSASRDVERLAQWVSRNGAHGAL